MPPPVPRPVIPLDALPPDPVVDAAPAVPPAAPPVQQAQPPAPVPVIPIAEPGVAPPAPFAQVYAPTAPPPPSTYYPPAYPPPTRYEPAWPDYRTAMARSYSRPGIITTLAVSGIIVAALSVVASLISGCSSLVVMGNARRAASVARMSAVTPPTVAPPVQATSPDPFNGLDNSNRAVVIQALRSRMRRQLSETRRQQLDTFLSEHGAQILNDPANALTTQKVAQHLGTVGQEYNAPGRASADFFVFKSGPLCSVPGRLVVYDQNTVFKPDDGSPSLRSQYKPGETQAPNFQSPPQPIETTGLDDDEAGAVIARIRLLSNNRLNAQQTATLTTLLTSPSYANWLTQSSTTPGLTAQVKSAVATSDGKLTITFTMGKLALDRQGAVIGPIPQAPVGVPTTNRSTGPQFVMGTIGVEPRSCTLAVIEALISGLVAIYLMVVAIMTFRQTGMSRKFWIIYALLKIPLSIMALVAFGWMISSMNVANDPMGIATSMMSGFKGMAATSQVLAGIGLAYPIAILLTLTLSKTARDFYKTSA